jgi:hypothetical protein
VLFSYFLSILIQGIDQGCWYRGILLYFQDPLAYTALDFTRFKDWRIQVWIKNRYRKNALAGLRLVM